MVKKLSASGGFGADPPPAALPLDSAGNLLPDPAIGSRSVIAVIHLHLVALVNQSDPT